MKSILKVVCSYCNKDMDIKEGNGTTGTSHSICPICLKKEMKTLREMKLNI